MFLFGFTHTEKLEVISMPRRSQSGDFHSYFNSPLKRILNSNCFIIQNISISIDNIIFSDHIICQVRMVVS